MSSHADGSVVSSSVSSVADMLVAGGGLVEPVGEEAYGVRAPRRTRELDLGLAARVPAVAVGCAVAGTAAAVPGRDAQGEHDGQGWTWRRDGCR